MRRSSHRFAPLLLMGFLPSLLTSQVPVQKESPARTGEEPGDDWLKLLNTKVETATKGKKQTLAEAPAIMAVVTSEEIRALGYRSVAEALRSIPGFYAIDDRVAPNIGVRGINGGLRAYGRIMKVMINGQPIAFRPDGANFMGPEMIPMEAVDRIEVIRGPASSLYGADAFLGVVNVITRKLDQERQPNAVVARAGFGSKGSLQSLEAKAGILQDSWDLLVAASGGTEDRSGYRLPSSSPTLITNPALGATESSNDKSRPLSALLSSTILPAEGLTLNLLGSFSRLEAHGEFLDFGVLNPANVIAIDNTFGRLKLEWAASRSLSIHASVAVASGKPSRQEHLDIGASTSFPRRDIGYDSVDMELEGHWSIGPDSSLTLGADNTSDQEQLMNVYTVNTATGEATPTLGIQGRKRFSNAGLYAQYLVYPIAGLGLTFNVRNDQHNIYGDKTTYRLGLVYAFTPELHTKLLHGTSFKAPTAWQLYAQPLFGGEVIGNPDLKPESARTTEVEFGWKPSDRASLSLNGFWNKVEDKVELVQRSGNQFPLNMGLQDSHGVEAQAHLAFGSHQLTGSLAWQKTDAHLPVPFAKEVVEPTSMYPSLTGFIRWRYLFSPAQSTGLEGRYASDRRATDSNITDNFLRSYKLDAYALVDAFWAGTWKAAGAAWRAQLRLNNLLDKKVVEPGFAGVDLPGYGRQAVLTFGCQF